MGSQNSVQVQPSIETEDVTQPKPSLAQMFHEKSNEVNPGPEYYTKGKKVANEVFDILRQNRSDVDRVIVAGSIGKRTAVNNGPDFDVVIFLNNKKPPFGSVLEEIKKTFNSNKRNFENYYIPPNDMFISFESSGYKFDMSPATNYGQLDNSQFIGTRKAIKELQNPIAQGYLYSPGFAESSVEFLKSQTPFAHSIIRLAKHWSSNVKVDGYIRGRSMMMELITIHSCNQITAQSKNSLYLAFKQFLENIKNFNSLSIIFEEYYKKKEIPKQILKYNGPIIMDPVNCYNNLATNGTISTSAVSIFITAAEVSLERLEEWDKNPNARSQSFNKIFEPQSC